MTTTSDHTLIAFRNDIYLKFEKKVIIKTVIYLLISMEIQKTARKNKYYKYFCLLRLFIQQEFDIEEEK